MTTNTETKNNNNINTFVFNPSMFALFAQTAYGKDRNNKEPSR